MAVFDIGTRRYLAYQSDSDLQHLRTRWGLILATGIVFLFLGFLAATASGFTTVLTLSIFGWVLMFSGLAQTMEAFSLRKSERFTLELLSGLLYLIAGFVLIRNPTSVVTVLTLMVGPLFLVMGTLRAISAISWRGTGWPIQFVSGVITFALGVFVLNQGPSVGLWLIGLFIGVELMVEGLALISFGLTLGRLKNLSAENLAA